MGPDSPLLGTVALLACLAAAPGCGSPAPSVQAPSATVVEIIDGDTLVVRSSGRTETIRLIGIDTPEIAHHGRPAECFGAEASARLRELTPPGSTVILAVDLEARDAYERMLAYVSTPDAADVATALAREGFATELAISPNLRTADDIALAVADARSAQRGLWQQCPPPE